MAVITDEFMREIRAKARVYSLVLLKRAARYSDPDAGAIIWEHGRRNHSLRADGVLAIVCPVADDSEWAVAFPQSDCPGHHRWDPAYGRDCARTPWPAGHPHPERGSLAGLVRAC